MYYVAALVAFLLAAGAWLAVTAPFIRSNREEADPQYAGFLIEVFSHLFFAIAISISREKKLPIGVYAHGVLLIAAVSFGVLGSLSG